MIHPFALGLDTVALVIAAILLVALLDRMRVISWKTARPEYVALYLAETLWCIGVILDAMKGNGVELYQLGALVATSLWLFKSRRSWQHGPPAHVQTGPVPLDEHESSQSDWWHA